MLKSRWKKRGIFNFIIIIVEYSQIKEKPCEEEMQLFSDCLVKGENCEEFEEKYFKCMQAAE